MKVEITSMYIGQGMANLIEVEKEPGEYEFILIDFGSVSSSGITGSAAGMDGDEELVILEDLFSITPSTGNAREILEKKLSAAKKTEIDLLLLSHLDKDHYNFVKYLDPTIKFKKVIIGGTTNLMVVPTGLSDSKIKVKINNEVSALMKSLDTRGTKDIQQFSILDGFANPNSTIYKCEHNLSTLRLMLLCQRAFPTNDINTNSAVVALIYEYRNKPKVSAIFPGDATDVTLDLIVKMIESNKTIYAPLLDAEERYLSLPHHGSFRTLCDGQVFNFSTTPKENLTIYSKFIELYKPNYTYASAYFLHSFHHPVTQVFEKAEQYCKAYTGEDNWSITNNLEFTGNKTFQYKQHTHKRSKRALTSISWKESEVHENQEDKAIFYNFIIKINKGTVKVTGQNVEEVE